MSANSRESANRCEATDGEASIPKDEDFTNPHSSLDSEITTYENRQFDFQTVMATISLAFTYEAALLSFVLPTAILLSINADIGPSKQLNWIATSWSLASAIVQTITGRCSDIFGRRNFIVLGNLFGLIGCVIASRAAAVEIVMVGMALMGIGSGAQQLSFACANEIVPKKSRGQTLAFLNLAALPGSAFGSVIGLLSFTPTWKAVINKGGYPAYAIVTQLTWRWTFYVGTIANGFALALTILFYWPPSFIGLHPDGKSRWQQFKQLDFLGLFLFAGGLGSFLLGISWANNPYSWRSKHVLAPLLFGSTTLFVSFPAWQIYGPRGIAKLCPPQVFENGRGFTLPLCVAFVSGMLLTSLQVLWPQEVQMLFTTDPTTVGWYCLSYNAAATLGAVVTGVLFARVLHTRCQFVVMTCIQTVFIALMAAVTQSTPGRAIAFVIVAAFGIGACQIIAVLIIQFGAMDDQIGVATGLTGTVRATGGAIAIAIYGTIINSKATADLTPKVAAAATKAGLAQSNIPLFIDAVVSGSADAVSTVEGVTPDIIAAGVDAMKSVYADAFRLVFLVSLAFGVPSTLAACFVRSVDAALLPQVVIQLKKIHIFNRTATPGTANENVPLEN